MSPSWGPADGMVEPATHDSHNRWFIHKHVFGQAQFREAQLRDGVDGADEVRLPRKNICVLFHVALVPNWLRPQ